MKIISLTAFYAPIQNTTLSFFISLMELFKKIKSDNEVKVLIEKLRALIDPKERSDFKKEMLFVILFSGLFSKRCKEGLQKHSGIICVDIDNLSREEISIVTLGLKRLQLYLVGYFVSPSGNGYKILFRVNSEKYSHEDNYKAAVEYLKSEIEIEHSHYDMATKDVARACFISHDPNAYLNKNIEINNDFGDIPILETEKWLPKDKTETISSSKNNDVFSPFNRNSRLDFKHKCDKINFFILISIITQKIGKYSLGNRHNFLQKLASYANQFGMEKLEFIKYCIEFFEGHPQTLIKDNVLDINKELLPLIDDTYKRYAKQFGMWEEQEAKEEMETPCFPDELFNELPEIISKPTSLFHESRERDVYFMGMLGVLSTCMPKVQGIYDGKLLGANLFILISAPAAAGKGTLLWARKLCKEVANRLKSDYDRLMQQYELDCAEYEKNKSEIEKPKKPLRQKFTITGNASSAAMISCIQANIFFGLIFETEADTLSNTLNNNDWGNWNDILRKCFQHEPVSLLRKKDNEDIEIEKPYLSMLLSGTPSQIIKLVSSIENGFFSRILFYDFPSNNDWKDVFAKRERGYEDYFDGYAIKLEQWLAPYFYNKAIDNKDIVHFEFTSDQESLFNKWFAEKQSQLAHIYGDDIIASVRRLAICFFRIALILSVMRHIETYDYDANVYRKAEKIICTNVDYKNTEQIIDTLLLHTIKIFNQVKKTNRNKFSKGKKVQLLEKLPLEFNRATAMQIASFIGIKEKTAENYLTQFISNKNLERVEHNQYKKTL